LGIHINAVMYVTMVMSIGLLVDFIMHVLLRYYESPGDRREKTTTMLRTMGASILVGGISTFLGTLPLAFSTSEIFYTIFVAFLGLVTLGCGHGLILMPVIISTIGPEDQIRAQQPAGKYIKHQQTSETLVDDL
jgi:Niemann-Pick C1 protein